MGRDKSWLAPLTGVAFFVLAVAAFAVSGEPPDPTVTYDGCCATLKAHGAPSPR